MKSYTPLLLILLIGAQLSAMEQPKPGPSAATRAEQGAAAAPAPAAQAGYLATIGSYLWAPAAQPGVVPPAQPAAVEQPGYLATAGSYLWAPVTGIQWAGGQAMSAAQATAEYGMSAAQSLYNAATCSQQHYSSSFEMRRQMAQPDAHSYQPASVHPIPLSPEQEYVAGRRSLNKTALEQFTGQPIEERYVPTIGFCFSGGGYRAMLETLGWLSGAQKIGLLDAGSYMTGLSGSTWALNPWVASGLSLQDYKNQLLLRLEPTLSDHVKTMTDNDIKEVLIAFGRKYYQNQSIGIVDLFGVLLAHLLLHRVVEKPYSYQLSQVKLNDKMHPFPISTAVVGGAQTAPVRQTVEFSPSSVGSYDLKAFIPTWSFARVFDKGENKPITPADLFAPEKAAAALLKPALGAQRGEAAEKMVTGAMEIYTAVQKFRAGKTTEEIPQHEEPFYGTELSLGFIMATCGSAFAVDMYNAIMELNARLTPEGVCPKDVQSLHNVILVVKDIMATYLLSVGPALSAITPEVIQNRVAGYTRDDHYAAAFVPNFMYNLPNNPLANPKVIGIVDGGFSLIDHDRLNIAIMPLLRRDVNVITICDAGWDLKGAPSLRAAEHAAHTLGLKFPKIDYTDVDKKIVSMFVDENNLDAPIIVYMPGIQNPDYGTFDPEAEKFTGTFNFEYRDVQAMDLMGLLEHSVAQTAKDTLREACRLAIERKKKKAGWRGAVASWWSGR